MKIQTVLKLYDHMCEYYFIYALFVSLCIFIVSHSTITDFNTFLIFEVCQLNVLDTCLFFGTNSIIFIISHTIINKMLKRNFVCVIWIVPLFIQIWNLIKVITY